MNTPNKLTIIRMILAPVFLAVLLWESLPHNCLYACIIFAIASATDWLDGRLARKNNQITTFGKFLDPIADKLLTTSAMLAFISIGLCNVWIVMIVLAREFIVTSVRMIASSAGTVISAGFSGKLKTVVQVSFIMIVLILIELMAFGVLAADFPLALVSNLLFWVTAILSVISGILYTAGNREFISVTK